MDVDLDSEEMPSKKCYKLNRNQFENLKITRLPATSTIVLWNKYQILFYELSNFETPIKILIPEFKTRELLVTNNYLLCIDFSGNCHVTSLKFKNATQIQLKCVFQPKQNNVKTFLLYSEDLVLTLKFEYNTYFLCLDKLVNHSLQFVKKSILILNEELLLDKIKDCMLVKNRVNDDILRLFSKKEEIDDIFLKESDFIVLSFDRYTVYGCVYHYKLEQDEINLTKLYSSPSEVNNIEITSHQILVSLTIGTVLILNLNNIKLPPKIIHLNTSIEKILTVNENLVYTDGNSVWFTENTFSDKEMQFKDLSIKNVKDFIVFNNRIICTTYNKLLYVLPIDSIFSNQKTSNSAKALLNNSQYIEKIFNVIEKNNVLIQDLNLEQNYILAATLCNRQDFVHKAIHTQVYVFDYYEQISKLKDLTFTEEISKYTEQEIYIFLINISFNNQQQSIYNLLSNLVENCHFHITLLAGNKVVKTTTIELEKSLQNKKFLIPIYMDSLTTEFSASIKIIAKIPSAFDEQKFVLLPLYKNDISLNSEHFIRTHTTENIILKNPKETIDKMILEACRSQASTYNFDYQSQSKEKWPLYIKLPTNYIDIFKNFANKENLSEPKYLFIKEKLNNVEFLKSKSYFEFSVSKTLVKVEIENDGFSNPALKLMSEDLMIAHNLRRYFSKILYKDYADYESGKEFINWNFYATTENIQKTIKNSITKPSGDEEIHKLLEQFEKKIIGSLPL